MNDPATGHPMNGEPATRIARRNIENLSTAIKWMVRILVPIVVVSVLSGGIGGTAALIAALVMNHGLRWVCLGLAVLAIAAATLLAVRYVRTFRATTNTEKLADELLELTYIGDITEHLIRNTQEVVTREGGLRPWQRARALWRVLQTMSVVEAHVEARRHARYVLPPKLPQSWSFVLFSFWLGIIAVVGMIIIASVAAIIS